MKIVKRGLVLVGATLAVCEFLRWFYAEEDHRKGDQLAASAIVIFAHFFPLLTPLFLLRAWVSFDLLPLKYESDFVEYAGRWLLTPSENFDPQKTPPPPNYNDHHAWSMYPGKVDDASVYVPPNETTCEEHGLCGSDGADIFYFHPTMFYSSSAWNADWKDPFTIFMADNTVGPQQGCAFNAAGRMFAPRYRQMSAAAFLQKGGMSHKDSRRALKVAYSDARAAFMHYLEHEHQPGRGIILAGHSQGSLMVEMLVEEFFRNDPELAKELIAAYIVGWTTFDSKWATKPRKNGKSSADDKPGGSHVHVCEHKHDIGCVISFRTYARGGDPKLFLHVEPQNKGDKPVCTNPLSWERDGGYRPHTANEGYLNVYNTETMYNYLIKKTGRERVQLTKPWPEMIDAECIEGALYITEPPRVDFLTAEYGGVPLHHFAVFPARNWHTYDINFFYSNIRVNAIERTKLFRAKYA